MLFFKLLDLLGEAATNKAKEWKSNGGFETDEEYSIYGVINDMMTYHEAYQYLVENYVEPYGFQAEQKEEFEDGKLDSKTSFHVICASEFLIHLELSAKEDKLLQESDKVSSYFLDLTLEEHDQDLKKKNVALLEEPSSSRKSRRMRSSHKTSLNVESRRSRSLRRSSLQVSYEVDHPPEPLKRKRSKRFRSKSRN